MRLAGRITDWNDDRGFGFVVPHDGGERAFVHVQQFQRGSRRPAEGNLISYRVRKDERGRLTAQDIRHAGQRIQAPRQPSRLPRAALGGVALAAVGMAAALGAVPLWVPVGYCMLSTIGYAMYRQDKQAAHAGRRRTPELHLHLIGLAGGWPGALIAQQQWRHKTVKPAFQITFWLTVILHLAAVAWLLRSGVAAGFAT